MPGKKKKRAGSAKKLLKDLQPAGMVFTGMARPAKNDRDSIMFARPGASKWVKLHKDHIQDIKLVQDAHPGKHPLVNLVMKQPQSPEGTTFSGLAQLHSATADAPGSTDLCWDSGRQIWVRCPG